MKADYIPKVNMQIENENGDLWVITGIGFNSKLNEDGSKRIQDILVEEITKIEQKEIPIKEYFLNSHWKVCKTFSSKSPS